MNLEEFKNSLDNIIVIQDLPIAENVEKNIIEQVRELFDREYSFSLKDGCSVKMSKVQYKCAQEDIDDTEVYIIRSKYNTIFKCFTCGNLLISRNDLVRQQDATHIIKKEILFPMRWSEQQMVEYLENLICMMKSS